jgi:hypothetical protein
VSSVGTARLGEARSVGASRRVRRKERGRRPYVVSRAEEEYDAVHGYRSWTMRGLLRCARVRSYLLDKYWIYGTKPLLLLHAVRRDKAALSSGCKPDPARSLQPEATGAVMEVTNG